jgi:hypothetical protein
MSYDPYPLPAHAAYIWAIGDEIYVGFPPIQGDTGHTVHCKADAMGLEWVISLLKARMQSSHHHARHIGHRPTEPTQYQLDAILRVMKQGKSVEPKIDGSEIELDDLGL